MVQPRAYSGLSKLGVGPAAAYLRTVVGDVSFVGGIRPPNAVRSIIYYLHVVRSVRRSLRTGAHALDQPCCVSDRRIWPSMFCIGNSTAAAQSQAAPCGACAPGSFARVRCVSR